MDSRLDYSPATNIGDNIEAARKAAEAIENDREFKAHIYQQLLDLQPYLPPDAQISVVVEPRTAEMKQGEIALTLVAVIEDCRVEAEGTDTDMYQAFDIAKRRMLDQLQEWYAVGIDSTERDAQIRAMMSGHATLH